VNAEAVFYVAVFNFVSDFWAYELEMNSVWTEDLTSNRLLAIWLVIWVPGSHCSRRCKQ